MTHPDVLPKFRVLLRDVDGIPLATVYGATELEVWDNAHAMMMPMAANQGYKVEHSPLSLRMVRP